MPDSVTTSEALDHIRSARLAKLQDLERSGVRGFPTTFDRTRLAQEVVADFDAHEGQEVAVAGRLGVFRVLGKNLAFVPLTDDSGAIQLWLHPADLAEDARRVYDALDPGDFVGVRGVVTRTRRGEISVDVRDLVFLGKALRNPPEKWHGIVDKEIRYRQRYLDLMASPETRAVFRTRGRVLAELRRFLGAERFLEVETPVLQPLPGGGAARPFATYSNALDETIFLRIALELYLKRCVVGGFERVYEIGKVFRNEGVSFKHNPEFTMLELYQAYADYNDVMRLTERMVEAVAREVAGTTEISWGEHTIQLAPPWRRISLRDAIRDGSGVDYGALPDHEELRAAAAGAGLQVDRSWGRGKVLDELLTAFVEPSLIQPTFLVDYPTDFPGSTLAKPRPDDPSVVERFELFIGGMEVGNAFSELNDPRTQRQRFEEQALARRAGDEEAQPYDEDFLIALEQGMPPTGGLGIGVDRLVMLLTDQHSIRDVILFPQTRQRP